MTIKFMKKLILALIEEFGYDKVYYNDVVISENSDFYINECILPSIGKDEWEILFLNTNRVSKDKFLFFKDEEKNRIRIYVDIIILGQIERDLKLEEII
jgi:hypothetical protein